MNLKYIQLLLKLDNNEYVTSKEISHHFEISEKTVRNHMSSVMSFANQNGCDIQAIRGKGYKLIVFDRVKFNRLLNISYNDVTKIPTTSKERTNFLIALLLGKSDYIKVDDLTEIVYTSRTTLSKDLKRVEMIFSGFQLAIDRKPYYGIKVIGSEFSKRLCMAKCFQEYDLLFHINDTYYRKDIAHIWKSSLYKSGYEISEINLQNIVTHTFVSLKRIINNHHIHPKEIDLSELDCIQVDAVENVVRSIESMFGVKFFHGDIHYLVFHLSGKMIQAQGEQTIPARIDQYVLGMLDAIYEGLGLDLRDNLELRLSLGQHLVPLDIRLRLDMPQKNPLLEKIKSEYVFQYSVATVGCTFLNKVYKKNISEDEIAYFAILFGLVLNSKEQVNKRYNVVLVCATGRGSSKLFANKYKSSFGKYIDNLYEISIFDLETFDFESHEINYVFTTIPITFSVPVPVYEVSIFLEENEINKFSTIFERNNQAILHHFLDKRYFLTDIKAESKEDVLKQMITYLEDYISLPDNFYDLVMEREQLGQTDFGNLIAIPHPYKSVEGHQFVMLGILQNPIWWGHNDVQIILLISLTDKVDVKEVEQFYRVLTDWMTDKNFVNKFLKNPTYDFLIQYGSTE